MPQFKKDDVLETIQQKALQIFSQQGYLNTKMSHIAESAGISVGNIYTYFKNKETLFYTVVPEDIVNVLTARFVMSTHLISVKHLENKLTEGDLQLTDMDLDFFIQHRQHLLIIFENNAGTKYENARRNFIESLVLAQKDYLKRNHNKFNLDEENKTRLLCMIINSMLNLLLEVLKTDTDNEKRRELFRAVDLYRLHGLYGFME